MKKHEMIPSPREVALKLLARIENTDSFANLLLDNIFSEKSYKPEDRRLITQIVYGVTRRKLELDYIINRLIGQKAGKLPMMIRQILRIGLYQLRFLNRVPDYSAVNEAVELAKKYGHPGTVKLVNALLRNYSKKDKNDPLGRFSSEIERISITYSVPEFVVSRWFKFFGREKTIPILEVNQHPPSDSLRVNTNIIGRRELMKLLSDFKEEHLDPRESQMARDGIVLKRSGRLMRSDLFEKGYFIFQDAASQIICELLEPQKGELILDACAAPGTKTTHICQLTEDNARIIACDISLGRLKLLAINCKRLKVKSALPICCDLRSYKFGDSIFDKILLDAPCSCSGLFRRHPELRYKMSAEKIERLNQIQLDILNNISGSLKKGGIILYSTCSLEKEENEDVIEEFRRRNKEYTTIKDEFIGGSLKPNECGIYRIFPDEFGTDGFSFAILQRG